MSQSVLRKKQKDYYLIGNAIDHKYDLRNPPTLRKVMQNCLFHREQNKSEVVSVSLAVKNAIDRWESLGIVTQSSYKCEQKLKREFEKWRSLQKNQYYKSKGQDQRRNAFVERLDAEFNVRKDESLKQNPPQSERVQLPELQNLELSESDEEIGAVGPVIVVEDSDGKQLVCVLSSIFLLLSCNVVRLSMLTS